MLKAAREAPHGITVTTCPRAFCGGVTRMLSYHSKCPHAREALRVPARPLTISLDQRGRLRDKALRATNKMTLKHPGVARGGGVCPRRLACNTSRSAATRAAATVNTPTRTSFILLVGLKRINQIVPPRQRP